MNRFAIERGALQGTFEVAKHLEDRPFCLIETALERTIYRYQRVIVLSTKRQSGLVFVEGSVIISNSHAINTDNHRDAKQGAARSFFWRNVFSAANVIERMCSGPEDTFQCWVFALSFWAAWVFAFLSNSLNSFLDEENWSILKNQKWKKYTIATQKHTVFIEHVYKNSENIIFNTRNFISKILKFSACIRLVYSFYG